MRPNCRLEAPMLAYAASGRDPKALSGLAPIIIVPAAATANTSLVSDAPHACSGCNGCHAPHDRVSHG